jgi:hypothetical protein
VAAENSFDFLAQGFLLMADLLSHEHRLVLCSGSGHSGRLNNLLLLLSSQKGRGCPLFDDLYSLSYLSLDDGLLDELLLNHRTRLLGDDLGTAALLLDHILVSFMDDRLV